MTATTYRVLPFILMNTKPEVDILFSVIGQSQGIVGFGSPIVCHCHRKAAIGSL